MRVQGRALGSYRQALSDGLCLPFLAQEGEWGKPSKGFPLGKVRSMRAFSINERAVNCRLRTHWNYVGRHGADKFLTAAPRRLSGGQSCDGRGVRADQFAMIAPASQSARLWVKQPERTRRVACRHGLDAGIRSRLWSSATQPYFHSRA